MLRITSFDISELSPKVYELAMALMPEQIRGQVRRLRRYQDRCASLFGKVLLMEHLRREGFSPSLLAFLKKGEFGKPSLPVDLEFNISHSGSWVVCAALKGNTALGIDIEKRSNILDIDLSPYLTFREKMGLKSSSDSGIAKAKLWTRKEAVLKATGAGIGLDLSMVDTTGDKVAYGSGIWYLQEVEVHEDYSCSIACSSPLGYELEYLDILDTLNELSRNKYP